MNILETTKNWFCNTLETKHLSKTQRGIEREALRMNQDGFLSQQSHPYAYGSNLFHENITTDFSEALLEFITKPHETIGDCLNELKHIHLYAHKKNPSEYLWPLSMPPRFNTAKEIPIADYGDSPIGQMKKIYRKGLEIRYGKPMQIIAGIHYNISFSKNYLESLYNEKLSQGAALAAGKSFHAYKNDFYFALIRNYLRFGWIMVLLTGRSNQVDQSFMSSENPAISPKDIEKLVFADENFTAPYGTSLRMGSIGYQSPAQEELFVCYDRLETYVNSIQNALNQPNQGFQTLGLYDDQGHRHQITTNVLQIENEFYGSIRPKQPIEPSERPSLALSKRGVDYIEVRNIDIDENSPIGIQAETAAIIELFITACGLSESPFFDAIDYKTIRKQNDLIAFEGKNPKHGFIQSALNTWQQLEWIAEKFDSAYETQLYSNAWKKALDQLKGMQTTSHSPQVNHQNFWQLGQSLGQKYHQEASNLRLDQTIESEFEKKAKASLETFGKTPPCDALALEDYINQYFADLPPIQMMDCHAIQQ